MPGPSAERVIVACPARAQLAWFPGLVGSAVLASSRLIRDGRFVSHVVHTEEIWFRDGGMHQTFLSCDNPFVPEEERPLLDRRGIIRPGVSVKPGQVLVSGLSPIPFVEGEKDRVRRHIGRDSESRYSNWAAFHFANSFDERYWG
jgi:DNA-directed RNA polymerase beta subunit